MKMTKAFAKEILDIWKERSPVYRGAMTLGAFENILGTAKTFDGKPLLTQADVFVISMALKLAGAKLD
jgi:hypothetical protein